MPITGSEEAYQSHLPGALAYDHYAFLPENARFTLCEHFKVKSLDGFGCTSLPQAIGAAGAIIHYLKHQLRRKIDHLTSLRCEAVSDHVAKGREGSTKSASGTVPP